MECALANQSLWWYSVQSLHYLIFSPFSSPPTPTLTIVWKIGSGSLFPRNFQALPPNSLASLSEGVPGSSPSRSPAPFHRGFSHQPLPQHIDTDKQNRLECQDSAWARKTFGTLQVLLWGSLPLQGTCVPSLPHTPEKQQLSTSTASRCFQSQWSDSATTSLLSSYTTDESPNIDLQSTEQVLGPCSAYTLDAESHYKVCDNSDSLCHSVCPSLWHRPVRNHFKGSGFQSSSCWLANSMNVDRRGGRESWWQDHVTEAAHCLVSGRRKSIGHNPSLKGTCLVAYFSNQVLLPNVSILSKQCHPLGIHQGMNLFRESWANHFLQMLQLVTKPPL